MNAESIPPTLKEKLSPVLLTARKFILSPQSFFNDQVEKPVKRWWLPALLLLALFLILLIVSNNAQARQAMMNVPAVDPGMYDKGMVVSGPGGGGAYMGEMPSQPAGPGGAVTALLTVGKLLLIPLAWVSWCISLYVGTLLLGGRGNFKLMLNMVILAWLPLALRALVQIIYILISGQPISNPGLAGLIENPQSLGLTALRGLLSHIDLYFLWTLLLLSLGISVYGRLPRKKAIILVLSCGLVLLLITLIPAFLGKVAGGIQNGMLGM